MHVALIYTLIKICVVRNNKLYTILRKPSGKKACQAH